MIHEWGSVDGDVNADAILHDRRQGRRNHNSETIFNFLLLIGCAIWYGWTESAAALAIEIVAASWFISGNFRRDAYKSHTMIKIAERRTQILEEKVQEIAFRVSDRAFV